jgi:hypothetical protein
VLIGISRKLRGQKRLLDFDVIKHLIILKNISEYVDLTDLRICIIGDGFGNLM